VTDWARLTIDAEELQNHIDRLGEVGALEAGGLFRGLYDRNWQRAIDLVEGWMAEAGLVARRDAVGNLFGRSEGTASSRCVASGSHIDTVRSGGRYDGALGVLAALSAVKALLRACGPPKKSLEVLVTCEEEGSRFRSNFWGSRAIIGKVLPSEARALFDSDGVGLGDAMREVGLDPARIPQAARGDIDAFIELHIEQGRVLEAGGHAIGVVDTITGMHQARVEVTGRQDHAGTTPMDLRRDAMAGAAEMVQRIAELATEMGRPAVATVGTMSVRPGAVNIVPGEVVFTVDARHPVPEQHVRLAEQVRRTIEEVARRRGLGLQVQPILDHQPVPMDATVMAAIEAGALAEGLDYLVMASGAGHDSQILAERIPAGMIFVPSRDGRSHSPAEHTPIEQIVPGVRVLARALHRLAY
jgi:allantoate deiminase